MRKIATVIAALACMTTMAQDIKLPAPQKNQKSTSVVQALDKRHSVREYSKKELSNQELSNLCWAACGVSRDAEHRTAPTAMNKKEIRLYVMTSKATYEYLAKENMLKEIVKGDNRKVLAGGQNFVLDAPVSLVMVIDFGLFGSQNDHAKLMTAVDAGIVSENINLYCQSVGLCTVPRGTMDAAAFKKLLKLNDNQLPILNNPVGYPKGK